MVSVNAHTIKQLPDKQGGLKVFSYTCAEIKIRLHVPNYSSQLTLLAEVTKEFYAAINFIQNHPHPLGQTPGRRLEGGKNPPLGQSLCTKAPPPRTKYGIQRPHPQDIKIKNSDTI